MEDACALLQRVAARLKPLAGAAALSADEQAPTADEQEYLDFYQINFTAEFQGLGRPGLSGGLFSGCLCVRHIYTLM
jgi:hypothetical protein